LVVRHPGARAPAVRGVSFKIAPGECVGLVGGSGCGKSTLSRAIVGLAPPESGSVFWRGRDVASLGRTEAKSFRAAVQMVFQDASGALDPRMRVGTAIEEPLLVHWRAKFPTRASRKARVSELLERVELDPSLASRWPHELSGGQRQRVGIARALAAEPEVVLADEPVSALDVAVQAQLLRSIAALLRGSGLAMLFVSHDLAVVRCLCSRVLVMENGRIAEEGSAAEVFASPRSAAARDLLAAVPRL
ncbi:MAG: ABC transporter ATP-binding protein, partial [Kiritimatiellae bacterium]|nr:ABC transporter ATP-binding protein [Kiritimatiellia bacterium]